MQKEQIEPLAAQPAQAARDRAAQQRLDFATPRLAEIAFAGDPHPLGQSAAKRRADHLLRLAVAIARGEIDEVDPGLDRHLDGGDALLERRLAPHHAEPAAAQGQGRNRPQPAELVLLHELRAPVDGWLVAAYPGVVASAKSGEPGTGADPARAAAETKPPAGR